MKEKLKKINLNTISNILKASLIGVIVSILLVLVFAFILKFVELNDKSISLIDQIIKIVSISIAVIMFGKSNGEKFLIKSIFVGALYSVLTFLVFSILNGGINVNISIATDIIFSSMIGGVVSVLLSIIKKKWLLY